MSRSPERRLASLAVEIRDGAEDDLVEGKGLRVPIVRVACERDVILLHALDEFIGARAHRVESEFRAGLLGGLRRHHHSGTVGERCKQARIGLLQVEAHGDRVDDIDAVDRGELGFADRFGHRLVPLDVVFDRGSVEFFTILKGHSVAKLEGDHLAVLGGLPGQGKSRHDLEIGGNIDQLVAKRLKDDAADKALAGGRIEKIGIVDKTDAKRLSRSRGRGEHQGAGEEKPRLHVSPPRGSIERISPINASVRESERWIYPSPTSRHAVYTITDLNRWQLICASRLRRREMRPRRRLEANIASSHRRTKLASVTARECRLCQGVVVQIEADDRARAVRGNIEFIGVDGENGEDVTMRLIALRRAGAAVA